MTFYSSHSHVSWAGSRVALGFSVVLGFWPSRQMPEKPTAAAGGAASAGAAVGKSKTQLQKYINPEMSCLFSFHKEIVCLYSLGRSSTWKNFTNKEARGVPWSSVFYELVRGGGEVCLIK